MNSSRNKALSVEDLCVTFVDENGSLNALKNISFAITQNAFVSLLGPSGSGKSTLLRVLAGLLPPTHGTISFHGCENCGQKIGLVFQKPNLMPWRTVLENTLLPLEVTGVPLKESTPKALDLLELVGLAGFENSLPHDLSGGMAQRVAIARSLIQDPDILLLDEPFGALDALTRERMGEELLRIWQARQKTVLMVTHSISEALYLSDRVLILTARPGQICQDLTVDLPRPRVEALRYTAHFNELIREVKTFLD